MYDAIRSNDRSQHWPGIRINFCKCLFVLLNVHFLLFIDFIRIRGLIKLLWVNFMVHKSKYYCHSHSSINAWVENRFARGCRKYTSGHKKYVSCPDKNDTRLKSESQSGVKWVDSRNTYYNESNLIVEADPDHSLSIQLSQEKL